jgi:hypothetical protein
LNADTVRGKDKHLVRLGWCPCDVGGGKLDWCLAVAFQSVDAETYYECFDTGSDAIVNPNLADYYVHILSKTSREVRLRAFKSLDLFLSEFTNAITSTIEDITCKFKF